MTTDTPALDPLALLRELEDVKAERDALHQTLTSIDRLKVDWTPTDGLVEIKNEIFMLYIWAWGEFFKEHKGVNFVTSECRHPELGNLEITVRKANGKTPAERIAELESEIAAMRTKYEPH